MTYEEFASDLPPDRTWTFSSAEENEEKMKRLGVNQQIRQLGKGKFRGDLAARSTEHGELWADRFTTATSMVLEPPAGMAAFLVFRSAGGRLLASGEEAANDKLSVMPPGSVADLVTPDLFGSDAVTLPADRFVELTDVLCPSMKPVRPDGLAVLRGDTEKLHALREAVVDLVSRPELDPRDERSADLVAEMVAWMGDSSQHASPGRVLVNGARRRVAKRAQEFLEEHYWDTIQTEDLCRAAGVGVRTLQRCFREYFDLTITDYLKVLRLNAARRELAAAEPGQVSVTDVAMRHGFAHLGRFSLEFRDRFGESPRETLAMRLCRTS